MTRAALSRLALGDEPGGMGKDLNSKVSRVEPVFGWLERNGGSNWTDELLDLVEGIDPPEAGAVQWMAYEREVKVPPSTQRLAWMLRNADQLVPRDPRRWLELRRRALENPHREAALESLDAGNAAIPTTLQLEGSTSADCLVVCEQSVVWFEGKRYDWLEPSITWDVCRDQLARNTEAVWAKAQELGVPECWLIICYEDRLKLHEAALFDGYRSGTWSAGWPHPPEAVRRMLGSRIGAIRWREIVAHWPGLSVETELRDLVQS